MTDFNKIPDTPHYAILRTVSVTIPGDERSRTHPGHGYSESTETYITYSAYNDRDEWQEEIKKLMTSRFGPVIFKAIEVNPVKVVQHITVETITNS